MQVQGVFRALKIDFHELRTFLKLEEGETIDDLRIDIDQKTKKGSLIVYTKKGVLSSERIKKRPGGYE